MRGKLTGNGNLQRDGVQVNQKERPTDEWQEPSSASFHPSLIPEQRFGAGFSHFGRATLQQHLHRPGQSASSPGSPTASLPATATPQGGETPPASPRWPFPCLPQLFLAAPRSPRSPAHQQTAPELLSPCKPSQQGKLLLQETTQSP